MLTQHALHTHRCCVYRVVEAQLASLEKNEQMKHVDLESEVEKTVAILGKLCRFVSKLPHNRLKELFTRLGACLTIHFEHPTSGRRRNVPGSAEFVVGKDGKFEVPEDIKNGLPNKAGGVPAMLGKQYRGDRI